jgi:hypothetical protein
LGFLNQSKQLLGLAMDVLPSVAIDFFDELFRVGFVHEDVIHKKKAIICHCSLLQKTFCNSLFFLIIVGF